MLINTLYLFDLFIFASSLYHPDQIIYTRQRIRILLSRTALDGSRVRDFPAARKGGGKEAKVEESRVPIDHGNRNMFVCMYGTVHVWIDGLREIGTGKSGGRPLHFRPIPTFGPKRLFATNRLGR